MKTTIRVQEIIYNDKSKKYVIKTYVDDQHLDTIKISKITLEKLKKSGIQQDPTIQL